MRLINIVYAGPLDEAPPLSSIVANILWFMVTIIGSIAVLMIVIAGVMYMTSGGDQTRTDTAKSTIKYAIIGLIVAIISLIIVTQIVQLF